MATRTRSSASVSWAETARARTTTTVPPATRIGQSLGEPGHERVPAGETSELAIGRSHPRQSVVLTTEGDELGRAPEELDEIGREPPRATACRRPADLPSAAAIAGTATPAEDEPDREDHRGKREHRPPSRPRTRSRPERPRAQGRARAGRGPAMRRRPPPCGSTGPRVGTPRAPRARAARCARRSERELVPSLAARDRATRGVRGSGRAGGPERGSERRRSWWRARGSPAAPPRARSGIRLSP